MGYYSKLMERGGDVVGALTNNGMVWRTADGDQNDGLLSPTSFANTTPLFTVDISLANASYIIPIEVAIAQSGTVGTGPLTLIVERDNIAKRASSGTLEAQYNVNDAFNSSTTSLATVYSLPTATAGYGVRLMGKQVGADVDTAEGVDTEYLWTPNGIELIGGKIAASWAVFLYSAGGTGATVMWSAKFAVVPFTDW